MPSSPASAVERAHRRGVQAGRGADRRDREVDDVVARGGRAVDALRRQRGARAGPVRAHDVAARLEQLVGARDRRARATELGGERALARQPLADGDAAVEQQHADAVGERLRDRASSRATRRAGSRAGMPCPILPAVDCARASHLPGSGPRLPRAACRSGMEQ